MYIAGHSVAKKQEVYDIITRHDNRYIVNLSTPAPKVRATLSDITNMLCKHTMPISYGVRNFEPAIYVCYDYLLPVLISYYFQSSRGNGLSGVYGLLERLYKCTDFVIPSYIHYIPIDKDNFDLGVNCFHRMWSYRIQSRLKFKRMVEYVSWECFIAMQDVFSRDTYFDVYNPKNVKVNFPITNITNNIYRHTTMDLVSQKGDWRV